MKEIGLKDLSYVYYSVRYCGSVIGGNSFRELV